MGIGLCGDAEEVKRLLASGWVEHVNAKATDGYGASLTTPLHLAAFCRRGRDDGAAHRSRRRRQRPETKSGWTPVHTASAQAAKVVQDEPSKFSALVKLEHPAETLARFEAAAILLRDAGATLGPLEAWRRQGWPAPEDQGLARGACGASSNESPGLHE